MKSMFLYGSSNRSELDLDNYFKNWIENHLEEVPYDVWKQITIKLKNERNVHNPHKTPSGAESRNLESNNKRNSAVCIEFNATEATKLEKAEEIIRIAAKEYPLNTRSLDWEIIQKKLKLPGKFSLFSWIRDQLIKPVKVTNLPLNRDSLKQ